VELRLAPDGAGTRGEVAAELQIRGRVATLGRGVLQDVADKLCQTFAANLAGMLAGAGGPAAGTAATSGAEPPAAAAGAVPAAARAPASDGALPALEILAGVVAGRLARPRALLLAAAGVFALGFLAGRCG
jgi:hypothetical protein